MPRPETVRAIREATAERRRQRRFATRERPCLIAGVLALLVALPLPWLFGGSGVDLAIGAGTVWELRFAAGLGPLLALAGVAYLLRRCGGELVLMLDALALGAQSAFLLRWEPSALGAGFWLSGVGALLVLAACWAPARARTGELGAGVVGAAIFAYQVVGPWDPVYLVVGAVFLVAGGWKAWRHEARRGLRPRVS